VGTFKVLQDFRRLIEAIRSLAFQVEELASAQRGLGPAVDRLTALELSRHQFEAEIQGVLLRADGKLKAANNAEARERQLKKSYERDVDPFSEDGEEVAEAGRAVLPVDVASGEAQRLSALRLGLAADPKAAAMMAKWSR